MKQTRVLQVAILGQRKLPPERKGRGSGVTHFLFLRRCLVWPRKGVGHRAGVGPVLGLRRKWSPSLSVSVQLGVQLQPRTVVKGKG